EPRAALVQAPDEGSDRAAAAVVPARTGPGGLRPGPARSPGQRGPVVVDHDWTTEGEVAGRVGGLGGPAVGGARSRLPVGRWRLREGRVGAGEGGGAGGPGRAGRRAQDDRRRDERAPRVDGELVGGAARPQGARDEYAEAGDRRRTPGDLGRAEKRLPGGP